MGVAKTKALISCAVTAQLICAFVFAYVICWFSDAAAHIVFALNTRTHTHSNSFKNNVLHKQKYKSLEWVDLHLLMITVLIHYLSRLMGKPTICIGENKDADQLRGNRVADQRLCFRYTDSTIPLLLKSEISSF